MRQWEIWKGKPAGSEREHWFVLLSSIERLSSSRQHEANGLACFTLCGLKHQAPALSVSDGGRFEI